VGFVASDRGGVGADPSWDARADASGLAAAAALGVGSYSKVLVDRFDDLAEAGAGVGCKVGGLGIENRSRDGDSRGVEVGS